MAGEAEACVGMVAVAWVVVVMALARLAAAVRAVARVAAAKEVEAAVTEKGATMAVVKAAATS